MDEVDAMKSELARLEKIDLRDIWTTEAGDFTPWLAKEENLLLLSDSVGLDLELEATEKNVGPFRADILCKDIATDNWVLIENQLAKSDHTHLGQLLTYASGLKAVTIVWIAHHFTEEHRAALDWLNEITDERFNFFALEIELWRIGSSAVAPKFNMISKPNDWTKTIGSAASRLDRSDLTETKLLQQEYWEMLRERLIDLNGVVKPQKPPPQHWTNFAIGRSHFNMYASVNTQKKWISVGMSCNGPDAKSHYHLLVNEKNQIEEDIGCSLEWEELPERKESKIVVKYNADPTEKSDWGQQHEWLADKLDKFHRTLGPRIKLLDADEFNNTIPT